MITLICIHCSATKPSMDIGLAEIDEWHKQRGWSGCGYNYIGRRDGTVERGRAEGSILAHAKGFNENAIAYCMVGGISEHGVPEANFQEAQWKALRAFCDWMKVRYPDADLLGHRDLNGVNKSCPCFDVRRWYATGEVV